MIKLNESLDSFLRIYDFDLYEKILDGNLSLLTLEIQEKYYKWLEEIWYK